MLAVLDCRAPDEAEAALIEYGYRILRLPPHPRLPAPVASHPDMLLFFAPHAILCTQSYARIAQQELKQISNHLNLPLCTIKEDYGARYPNDVLLNAASVGDYLLCFPQAIASELTKYYKNHILPVRQGYTKCSTLPIGKHALITEDPSIFKTAACIGLDVLRISSGHIQLNGYDYGFIGGCASFSPYEKTDTVYFCGDLSSHPDDASITAFCKRHGFHVRSLGTFPLTDIGTMFLI